MSSEAQTGFADLGSHKIFYKIAGQGPRLMIITGTNSDTRHTPTIYDAPGADKFELLNFDHRGMGQSGTTDTAPEMADYADDIAKLLDHLGWDNTAVVGVSFGGMVAQHFALRHPDRVTRLALCCTSPGGDGGSSYPLHTLLDKTAEEYARFIMKKMNVKHDDAWQEKYPVKAKATYEFYLRGADQNFGDPERFKALKNQFMARSRHNTYDQLHLLPMPVLVAAGIDDGVAPPENAEAMADVIPKSELKIFRGGHLFMKEDPKAWPYLFNFLKGEET